MYAQKIKEKGLVSMKVRVGLAVASPYGAFVKDRTKNEPRERFSRLKVDVAYLLFLGAKPEEILSGALNDQPLVGYAPGGIDPSADRLALDAAAEKALLRFKEALPSIRLAPAKERAGTFFGLTRAKETLQLVEKLQGVKSHYLTRLSVQFVHYYYRIEELQTSTHVYFSKPQDAVSMYQKYKAHLGASNPLVVLRVKLDTVAWLEDLADGGAIKIKDGVAPALLEIMESHDNFANADFRTAPKNWKPLADFAPPPARAPRPRNGYVW
ncbi:hypothetical protein ASC94_00650 [Massilia sp. Root418]|nr:hypothetical protein ASC94_00650 [Massilia sp. Root418]